MINSRQNDKQKMPLEEAINVAGFGLYSYIMIAAAGITIISFVCVSYGNIVLVPASACELNTTSGQQGALAAAPVVGTIAGSLVWGYLADTRGRRPILLVSLLGAAVINMVASISVNWIMLMVIQFTASFFTAGLLSISMSLLSESVPMAKRNLVVILATSLFVLAQGIIAVVAIPVVPLSFSYYLPALGIYWNSWRTLIIIYSIPAVISAIWLFFMQESPKFVFAKGDEQRTIQILTAIYKVNNLFSAKVFPVTNIVQEQSEMKEGPLAMRDQIVPLFKQPLLKYTFIMTVLLLFQQIGSIMVWLPTIANQFVRILETGEGMDLTLCGVIGAGLEAPIDPDETPCALNMTSLLMVLAVGGMQSFFNIILSLVVDKVGRRNSVMVITAFCGVAGILVNLVPNAMGSIVMFAIMLLGFIVYGLYTAIIVALFPTQLRAMAIALPIAGGRLGTFASIQILNLMLVNNCDAGFYLYATIFASSAIVASFLPDDRRLTTPKASPKQDQLGDEVTKKST